MFDGIVKTCLLLFAAVVSLSILTGCANPINAYTADKYYNYGIQAAHAGDYALARTNFYRAYVNTQMGNLGPAAEASCAYEVARMTGYVGRYADAERDFNETLILIEKAKGKADELRAPTLCELARLLSDTGQYQKAIPVYEKAVAELEKTPTAKNDPIAFADFLDDYASSLRAAGETARGDEIAHRAAVIREENKGLTAKYVVKRYKVEPSARGNAD
jgi:tetratricopeptide (TPR) repeat protein